jgi:hypothetical protein
MSACEKAALGCVQVAHRHPKVVNIDKKTRAHTMQYRCECGAYDEEGTIDGIWFDIWKKQE